MSGLLFASILQWTPTLTPHTKPIKRVSAMRNRANAKANENITWMPFVTTTTLLFINEASYERLSDTATDQNRTHTHEHTHAHICHNQFVDIIEKIVWEHYNEQAHNTVYLLHWQYTNARHKITIKKIKNIEMHQIRNIFNDDQHS